MLLYIHIPFCDSKCHYCSFNSYVDKFHLKEQYMLALRKQLHFELERFKPEYKEISSLFIGGGTPSTIDPTLYRDLFNHVAPYLSDACEITTEANPNSASKEWIKGMVDLGVNRISFGVQSFDAQKLKLLNRAHTPQDAKKAIIDASAIGIQNISLDLIYATAGDTKELLERDLKEAFSLPINHISAYALTIEEGTPFEKKPSMSQEQLKHTHFLFEGIAQEGFEHYEISNFGRYKSRHNLGYWNYEEYIGLGSGAVGKLQNKRFYPTTDIQMYIKDPLLHTEELLSGEDIKIEQIFLGLRSIVGVDASLLNNQEKERAELLVQERKLRYNRGKYYNEDFLLADEITLFLTS